MNRRLMRIVTSAAIFIGVILVMSVSAGILMAGEKKAAESAAESDVKSGDSKDTKNPNNADETENGSHINGSSDDADKPVSDDAESGSQSEEHKGDKSDAAASHTGSAVSGNEQGAAAGTGTDIIGTEAESTGADSEPLLNEGAHTIVINAAHQKTKLSGEEPIGPGASKNKIKISYGATGVATDIPEYELTLAVAKLLKDELISRGYSVVMIREENDFSMSDAERARFANDNGEAVIHIHGNADEREGIAGIMAFYPSADNSYAAAYSSSSKALCSAVLKGMENIVSAKNWGPIANDNLSELNWTKIPAAHVEIGYLSNKEEDKKLKDSDYRKKIAQGIADGIDSYFNQ